MSALAGQRLEKDKHENSAVKGVKGKGGHDGHDSIPSQMTAILRLGTMGGGACVAKGVPITLPPPCLLRREAAQRLVLVNTLDQNYVAVVRV